MPVDVTRAAELTAANKQPRPFYLAPPLAHGNVNERLWNMDLFGDLPPPASTTDEGNGNTIISSSIKLVYYIV